MSAELGAALKRQATLEQERRLLIGALAHDLRTPLFALRGYLEGLETGVATTPEKAAGYIAVCRDKADDLERLIADLFAYTRLEYLEQCPQQEPLALDALLRQLVEDMRPLVAVKGVTLTTEGWPVPCPLVGDGHLLARAVQNLLDNALRHTPADGCISLQWRQEGLRLVITVADTGLGIALHDLPHLFTPMYRGEASRNRHTGGAGLGLTIAQRIFQAHGGDVVAANQEAGGAIFTATLPVGGRSREPVAAAVGDRSAGRGADRGDPARS
jgi:signal transduction histidine kinase